MKRVENEKYGKKMEDIAVNKRQHFIFLTIVCSVFLALLFVAVLSFCCVVNFWFCWLVGILLFLGFTAWMIFTFLNEMKYHKTILYEKYLVVKSMWADTEIDLKSVFGAEPITSVTDRLFKIRTHTIVLHIKSFSRDKYILHYIDEDPERICNKIMKLAVKTRK